MTSRVCLNNWARRLPTFARNTTHYHRRGGVSLSCSGWEGVVPPCYGLRALTCSASFDARKFLSILTSIQALLCFTLLATTNVGFKLHGYRIKPHEQLVSVSSMPYSTYTPDLSTSWSRTTLLGGFTSGKTHLQASFPLRCFQRLSLPHLATRQCHWRDNRYTRGASTPVLSY